jgi:Fic family protein
MYAIEPIGRLFVEKTFKIQKPDLKSRAINSVIFENLWPTESAQKAIKEVNNRYLSWDEFRKKVWAAPNTEQLWYLVKYKRRLSGQPTSIRDKDGNNYVIDPHRHSEFQHKIDLEFGGNLLGISNFNEGDKRQIIRRNLIEESIASSKLEGANTSRETARRMLSEGRKPRDKSESMIANNHATMTWIEETGRHQKLSMDLLFDLHRKVVSGTLQNVDDEGTLRETLNAKGKELVIKPWDDETIVYVTPNRQFVEAELPKLIAFANGEDNSLFIHPLIKAIMLHFWIGLLHPFEDGNGRLARILFYWSMLRQGYWAFSYLSLSERILKSPKQYAMAFINSEQDDYDLNYFVQYNIEKLQLARQNMQVYLRSKVAENKDRTRIVEKGYGLNPRQIRLLQFLHLGESSNTSVAEHHNTNSEIGYISAVNDLKSLVEKNFLRKVKNGRNVIYLPTDKVQALFR